MKLWVFNAYVWSFCSAGWGWVAYVTDLPGALLLALSCGGLAAVSVVKANAN